MFQKLERPTVKVKNVVNTPNTKLPNTKLVKLLCSLKVKEDMTENNLVMVVKPNKFSTRKPRLPKKLF